MSEQGFGAVWNGTLAVWKPDQQGLNCLAEVISLFLSSTILFFIIIIHLMKVKVLNGKAL